MELFIYDINPVQIKRSTMFMQIFLTPSNYYCNASFPWAISDLFVYKLQHRVGARTK